MNIFDQLSNNKGTVSSALGKELAREIITQNRMGILNECIHLTSYEMDQEKFKYIRSGAAKVVEIAAEKRPELVSPHLDQLIPALSVLEPQTRWMIIRVFGFCAHLSPEMAKKGVAFAKKYIEEKEGLCIASSADLFLGDLGALSKEDAQMVFPILDYSMDTIITNEQDWLLEALFKIYQNLGSPEKEKVRKFAEKWQYSARKTTQERTRKILRLG